MAEDQPSRLFWKKAGDLVRPLNNHDRIFFADKIGDAETRELRVGFQTIGIKMHELADAGVRRGMNMHEREGRTGDLFSDAQMLGKPLHESGFAGAKRSFERQRFAAAQFFRHVSGEGVEFGERGNVVRHTIVPIPNSRPARA